MKYLPLFKVWLAPLPSLYSENSLMPPDQSPPLHYMEMIPFLSPHSPIATCPFHYPLPKYSLSLPFLCLSSSSHGLVSPLFLVHCSPRVGLHQHHLCAYFIFLL